MPSAGMCVCVRARVSANDSPTTPRARCSGLTATVYYGIEKATNREVAVKLMSRRTVSLSPTLMREISILKALKHQNIISVDVSAEKRDAALKAGAHKAVDGSGDGAEVTKRIVEAAGGPVLAVIDLVNGTATARFAFGALRKGGKLVQVGLFGGELMLPLPIMAIRALTVQGSYVGNPKELRELVKLA
ncbi:MAG: zinc-binding dehydrogenase, partial [Rhodospirillales bacterium]|nr:zinc-binding dehydrogenase [Rhodospirillales bacterium]